MSVAVEEHPFVKCVIEANEQQTQFTGTLSYRGFGNGKISGESIDSVRNQYRTICALLDNDGGMLRRGTIMLGYHNSALKGEVLLPDGEVIGHWEMEEDDDWSHFTPEGSSERQLTAPSAWMLQDSIGDWMEKNINEN